MLGKLLKYELPAMGKLLLPLFGAWLIIGTLLGFTFRVTADIDLFRVVFIFLYTAVAIAAGVMTLIAIIQRYRKNLLGDEGYFNLALPVGIDSHLISKLISATVWTVLAIVVGTLSAYLIGVASGSLDMFFLTDLLRELPAELRGDAALVLFEAFVITALGAIQSVIKIYAAISIGHLSNRHPNVLAVVAYIAFGTVESILMFIATMILEHVNPYWIEFLNANTLADLHRISWLAIALTLVLCIPYYFISHYVLKNKLNLA